jgi:hypothetical protein
MSTTGVILDKAILLKRLRAFYTTRGCRVQTTYFTSMHGEIIEDIELSCMLQFTGATPTPPARSRGTPNPTRPAP